MARQAAALQHDDLVTSSCLRIQGSSRMCLARPCTGLSFTWHPPPPQHLLKRGKMQSKAAITIAVAAAGLLLSAAGCLAGGTSQNARVHNRQKIPLSSNSVMRSLSWLESLGSRFGE